MSKKWITALLTAALTLSITACTSDPDTVVYVQQVSSIVGGGSIAQNDKFPGLVISENQTSIQRDLSQTIAKLYVSQGQEVKSGDLLFEYDSEAADLELSKQKLELERLNNNITNLKSQITQLEKEQKSASKDDQLSYTVEIQDRQAQLKEAEYNVKLKQKEIEQSQSAVRNAEVYSPVTGRVVSINENGDSEQNGYIVIQQSGSYRIKGTINELNMGAFAVGDPMRVISRTSESTYWLGTVSSIDLESASQDSSSDYMYGFVTDSSMTTSSSYTFYVELESTDGLMLGQHVYLELAAGSAVADGLWLPEYYICYTDEGSPFVWAADANGKLEQRNVTLGSYSDGTMTYEILDGLSPEDYIAFPSEYCASGVGTTQNTGEEVLPSGGGSPDIGGESTPDEGGEGGAQTFPADGGDFASGSDLAPDMTSAPSTGGDGLFGNLPIDGVASGSDLVGGIGDAASSGDLGG